MVQVICKRTGIEFTAKTSRSETHPRISAILKTAYEARKYSEVESAIVSCRESGETDIEQFVIAAQHAMDTTAPAPRYAAYGKNSYRAIHGRSNQEAYWNRMDQDGRTIESN